MSLGLGGLVCLLGGASGCLDRPVGKLAPATTNIIVGSITQTGVDKIDLLFMIDNSSSMADKQQILQAAVPELVTRLVNPICVNNEGEFVTQVGSGEDCPEGSGREFQPVNNINIGIITSSLGDFGSQNPECLNNGADKTEKEDMSHLLGSLARGQSAYQASGNKDESNMGFLAWRVGSNASSFSTDFGNLVALSGEQGCGLEASLEAWYRFLVDPAPYQTAVQVPCPTNPNNTCVSAQGIDQTVLDQRAAFHRPDSLLAIIMLTDENDCSIRVGSQSWIVASYDQNRLLWKSASICETDPNNECCYSCGLAPRGDCAPDPVCGNPDPSVREASDFHTADTDKANLRCVQHKKRFGIDFLYPVERYINALTQREICPSLSDLDPARCPEEGLVPNPLFEGSADGTVLARDPSLVFLAGIVGVPWQDLAVDPNDDDNLTYKSFSEMVVDGTWNWLLGEPPAGGGRRDGYNPIDPLMRESTEPRVGVHPVTMEEVAPITAGANANSINGHEWQPDQDPSGDLQYACIFPLAEERDCTMVGDGKDCDCDEASAGLNIPLCQSPDDDSYGSTQYAAKAYPGTRPLQVLEGVGSISGNAVVASICARRVLDSERDRQDYGYSPAIAAIVDRLKEQLVDQCLARPLAVDNGQVPCSIVEARASGGAACSCDANDARGPVAPDVDELIRGKLELASKCEGAADCVAKYCLCEIARTEDGAANDCLNNDVTGSNTNGWCYVAPSEGSGDNEALVENCPATAKRKLRFVGEGKPANGSLTFFSCVGAALSGGEE